MPKRREVEHRLVRAAVHQPAHRAKRRGSNPRASVRQVRRERPRQAFTHGRQTTTEVRHQRLETRTRLESDVGVRILHRVHEDLDGVGGVRRHARLGRVEQRAQKRVGPRANLFGGFARVSGVLVGGSEAVAEDGDGVGEELEDGVRASGERGEGVGRRLAALLGGVLETTEEGFGEHLHGGLGEEGGGGGVDDVGDAAEGAEAGRGGGLRVGKGVDVASHVLPDRVHVGEVGDSGGGRSRLGRRRRRAGRGSLSAAIRVRGDREVVRALGASRRDPRGS